MAYKLDNFLVQVSDTDRLLKIKNRSGVIVHTINGFSITSLRAVNNIVQIITKSNKIELDFSTTNEARIALSRLQQQIDLLKDKYPLFIDKEIENYFESVTQGPQGKTGPQGYIGITGPQGPIGHTGVQGKLAKFGATSSTPMQIPDLGEVRDLIVQTDLGYTPGQSVLIYNTLIDNYAEDYLFDDYSILFEGNIDSYNYLTGDLSVITTYSNGVGLTDSYGNIATYSIWYVNLTGRKSGSIAKPIGTITVNAGGTSSTTNSYLQSVGGEYMNIIPFVLPFDSTLIAISSSSKYSQTWESQIHVSEILISGATLSISNTFSSWATYSINFNAGDRIMLYCNGTSIDSPRIDAIFRQK